MKNKTIIITGAASGLGEAWVQGFLKDGADIIAADLNEEGLEALSWEGLHAIKTDVSSEPQVKAMIDFALEKTGRIDALFNNAGIGMYQPFLQVPEGEFEKQIEVHLYGAVYGMRHVLPTMEGQGEGRIINTISRGAELAAAMNSAYAAAKAAIWSATVSIAREYEEKDIRINMLIPGPTNTAIWGTDMPQMQSADVTYPTAKMLATLPSGGPNGKVFWDEKEYPIFKLLYE